MAFLEITKVEFVNPSIINPILKLKFSDDSTKYYIGSGEWVSGVGDALKNSYRIKKKEDGTTSIDSLVYPLYNFEKLIFSGENGVYGDYIISPIASEMVSECLLNSNATAFLYKTNYTNIPYKRINSTSTFEYKEFLDSISFYGVPSNTDSIEQTLQIGDQYNYPEIDESQNKFAEKLLIINPLSTSNLHFNYASDLFSWAKSLGNDFSFGTYSKTTSYITPKQYLNEEFNFLINSNGFTGRDYKTISPSGMYPLLEYTPCLTFNLSKSENSGPTMISTKYSKENLGQDSETYGNCYKLAISKSSDNSSIVWPELVLTSDPTFSSNETENNLTGNVNFTQTEKHKASVFMLDVDNSSGNNIYKTFNDAFDVYKSQNETFDLTSEKRESLQLKFKKMISDKLKLVVEELIPAHTTLLGIRTEE